MKWQTQTENEKQTQTENELTSPKQTQTENDSGILCIYFSNGVPTTIDIFDKVEYRAQP